MHLWEIVVIWCVFCFCFSGFCWGAFVLFSTHSIHSTKAWTQMNPGPSIHHSCSPDTFNNQHIQKIMVNIKWFDYIWQCHSSVFYFVIICASFSDQWYWYGRARNGKCCGAKWAPSNYSPITWWIWHWETIRKWGRVKHAFSVLVWLPFLWFVLCVNNPVTLTLIYFVNMLSKSIYIDPSGAKQAVICKCKDVTRQVLYANFLKTEKYLLYIYNVLLWLNDECTFYLIDLSWGWEVWTFQAK